jgi:hypothetical protein
MTKEALERFRAGVAKYGWYDYREGDDYDLAPLKDLDAQELDRVVADLEEKTAPDWPEVEVLKEVNTERSLALLRRWLTTPNIGCRVPAALVLIERGRMAAEEVEALILSWMPEAEIMNGLIALDRLIKRNLTDRVKAMVVWCARCGKLDARLHYAALAHFLYGVSATELEWGRRPFYFNLHDEATADAAYEKLCQDVRLSPAEVALAISGRPGH